MVRHSVLKDTTFQSVLASASELAPKGGKHKRNIVADLLLTALIDAFSILVIFLLMSFSATGEIMSMGKGQELPKAAKGEELLRNTVIKVDEGKLFIEDKEVAPNDLVAALLDVRKQFQEMHPGEEFPGVITVQADRRVKYEVLNSIVLATSHAGFSDLKFAVLMK